MIQSFQTCQSFLAYLLALLTTYVLLRVFKPAWLLETGRDLRRRHGRLGCAFLFCTVSLLAGHVVSKNIPRSTKPPQLIPEWFTALGYDPADTDGDGIPDCWERWTRTNRAEADDTLDPDGDGVDNFAEFWHQCDPMMADTDGDGYSDYTEITGRAVGKTWYDPIVPASYDYNDPDANTNGVPDRWEGTGYIYGFTDANGDGLPDGVPFPESGNGTFDVEVIVSTTRAALLSWGPSTNEAVVLPPCSCLPVRLRLSGYADTDVRLSCGTAWDGSEGLWYGRLVIRWPEGSGQETEENRIRIESDAVIDCDAMEVSFRGEIQTEPTRTPDDVPTSITSPFRRRWLYLNGLDGGCWEHSPGGWWAEAIYTNLAPPFAWYVNDNPVSSATGDGISGGDIHSYWNGETPVVVRCEWTNGPPHNLIKLEATETVGMRHCPSSTTNILPITSITGYDVVTNHVPDFKRTPNQYGPNCPETETFDIWAGFAHGEKPWERNFETIPTGNAEDDQTSHCHAIDWADGLEIDLEEYLPTWLLNHKDKLRFRVNGDQLSGTTIPPSKKPADLEPTLYHVEVCDEENTTLDRLWIVVLNPKTRTKFSTWVSENATNATWLASLPKPPSKIVISASGVATLPPSASSDWSAPMQFPTNSFMHPRAVYELRASSLFNEHGHQATYDADGIIITESIKAGTADISTPYPVFKGWRPIYHRDKDVHPYIRALQLDGNPVIPIDSSGKVSISIPRNLTRPPLRVGPFTRQYLDRRPTTPSGVQTIP